MTKFSMAQSVPRDDDKCILSNLETEKESGLGNNSHGSLSDSNFIGGSCDGARKKNLSLGPKSLINYDHAMPADQVGDKSVPIAIELPPSRKTRIYTPLTARGDLPGGYFPIHEPKDQVHHHHKYQGLDDRRRLTHRFSSNSSPLHSPIKSSPLASPLSPLSPLSPTPHSPLSFYHHPNKHQMASYTLNSSLDPLIPSGKYYPSNYKSTVNYNTITTTHRPYTESHISLPCKSLNIGLRPMHASPTHVKCHESRGSEAKKEIQQYQRDMIAQARKAVTERKKSTSCVPAGIMLQPIQVGTDGIITPFDLGDGILTGNEGYLIEGERRRKFSGNVEMTTV